jgi:UDP-N-acetylmuramate dehydrogenase
MASSGARVLERLREACGGDAGAVRVDAPLAPLTTFHVGGPADYLIEAHDEARVLAVLHVARELGVPLTVLGGGSNVLIGDRGIRGIVLLPRDKQIALVDRDGNIVNNGAAEWAASERIGRVDLDVDGDGGDDGVRAGAGLTINGLVRWTIGRGLAGLEAWAGTPGTVGGAIHGNAHFRGRNIGDLVREARVVTRAGDVRDLPASDMAFGYDVSRLQTSGELLLSAVFIVGRGEPDALRQVARASLAFRKKTQPLDMPSAGCIFQNPDPEREEVPPGVPPSAGALIDRAGLKGSQVGGARVSQSHGNFIVHDGAATAADIRALVERCKTAVADRFGVPLHEEIVYLGEF